LTLLNPFATFSAHKRTKEKGQEYGEAIPPVAARRLHSFSFQKKQPVSLRANRLYKEGGAMKFFVTSLLRGRSYRFVRVARLQPGIQI
jgi:hypothetical protein